MNWQLIVDRLTNRARGGVTQLELARLCGTVDHQLLRGVTERPNANLGLRLLELHAALAPGAKEGTVIDFATLAHECAPTVQVATLQAIARTESAFNPLAVGVVGGHLQRQPKSLEEALATVRALAARGIDFSLGIGQVNRFNLSRYELTYETAFDPCANLRVAGAILHDCYQRASASYGRGERALRGAISCYYSGNFVRGERVESGGSSYVQRVVANAQTTVGEANLVSAIPVIMDRRAGTTTQVVAGKAKSSPSIRDGRPKRQAAPHPPWDAFGDFDCDSDSCK